MIIISNHQIKTFQELTACLEMPEVKDPNSSLFKEIRDLFKDGDIYVFLRECGEMDLARRIGNIDTNGSELLMMEKLRFIIRRVNINFVFDGGVEYIMKYVEGGRFQMGAPDNDNEAYPDERPRHWVELSSFYIGETLVTQALWKALMDGNPSYYEGDNLPVNNVAWEHSDMAISVQEFINKLNEKWPGYRFRLPTEAEWEYAAKGGLKHSNYYYSGSNDVKEVAWYVDNSGGRPNPIKTKKANELGLYDMSGNVWEWCNDWKGGYDVGSLVNPGGPKQGAERVFRGGDFHNTVRGCRVTTRSQGSPDNRYSGVGFRLALSL